MSAHVIPGRQGISTISSPASATPARQALSAGWIALYTLSRHEKTVARFLQGEGIEQYLPLIKSHRTWRNRTRVELDVPLFHGYVFARIPFQDAWLAERAPGVIQAVRIGGKPAIVDDAEIDALRGGVAERNAQPYPSLVVGARARILCGAFAGQEGVLVRKEPSLRVVLSMHNVGLRFSVEVNGEEVAMMA